jgi:threonyl-tRNA synthetase
MPVVKLPDGNVKKFDQKVTAGDVAREIGPGLAKAALAAVVDDKIVGLDYPISDEAQHDIKLLTKKDAEAIDVMRHSCAHVMARAVMRLKKGVRLAFGPTVESGFYYDFMLEEPLTEDDFPAIEAEMEKIIKLDEPFERIETSREKAIEICQEMHQSFKVEHLNQGLADHQEVSFYQQGEFLDLCRGPHVPSPKAIGAFKLLSIAGAYWKGDAQREQLQRLYATAFFDQKDLDTHLEKLEEARRRDHRVLGKKLDLFYIDEMVGQGLILWAPKGAFVRQQLQDFISFHLRRQGYDQVFTPHIGKLELYRTSGHFPYYQDSQYPPIVEREQIKLLAEEGCSCADLSNKLTSGEIDGYLLKPMNCPQHVRIFQSQQRSYRDLPIRLSEFGTVYRWEQSGEIGGMTRVRGFTQDDAHLFVTEEQLGEELEKCIELVKIIFAAMGMEDYRVRVGLRDPESDKYIGSAENWKKAEAACREAAEKLGKPFVAEEGEAAFYGPKIDFVVRDCIGRQWQLGTVQVDYNLPERFGIEYIGADNKPHRPIMIHRAPFGSMERFIGVLIEHFAGAFPMWLAPEQIRVLPVSEKTNEYAESILGQLLGADLRATVDLRSEKLGAKIRNAQEEKIPYMLVVGPRDAENKTVSIRDRVDGDVGAVSIDDAIAKFKEEIENKTVRQRFQNDAGLVEDSARNEY